MMKQNILTYTNYGHTHLLLLALLHAPTSLEFETKMFAISLLLLLEIPLDVVTLQKKEPGNPNDHLVLYKMAYSGKYCSPAGAPFRFQINFSFMIRISAIPLLSEKEDLIQKEISDLFIRLLIKIDMSLP